MLQGWLIEKMENRILVGITMFVGIMILFGWVAINEPARMASFERQFQARAIERGAEKYAANCATCHGEHGLGIGGRAPALNNPHFFGFDYFAQVNNELSNLETTEANLRQEITDLAEEAAAEDTSDSRRDEINTRLAEITTDLEAIAAQREGLNEQKRDIAGQLSQAVLVNYPITEDEDGNIQVVASRLNQVGFGGSLEQYIITTLNHGRPGSASYWGGNQMSAWAQRGGGPLRDDQVRDVAAFILNWDKGTNWTIADALAVQQYGRLPGDIIREAEARAAAAGGDAPVPVGTDVEAIVARIEDEGIVGDSAHGEALYSSQAAPEMGGAVLGCNGCHANGVVGPDTIGTWTRVVNERLAVAQFEGYTPEQYVIESIVLPNDYIVPGQNPAMPLNFGSERLSIQDLADIVAFLQTQE